MTRTLTATDRSALIKLAATLPVGSAERRAILAGIAQPDMTYTVTSEELVRALYSRTPGASVKEVVPPGTQRGISVATGKPVWIYPDPNGPIEATEELTGETFRGYPVRMLTGDEQLKLTVMGEGPRTKIKVESNAPWVVDRFGAILTGRDAQRVSKWLDSRGL